MKNIRKILVICPFPEGVAAGQRLKYEQYFPHWRSEGYEVTVSPFMDLAMWQVVYTKGNYLPKIFGTLKGYTRRLKDIFRIGKYDYVYVHMWVTPLGSSIFERIIRGRAEKLIYDLEDNVFSERKNDFNGFFHFLKGRGKIKYLLISADHVITSSPFLNEYCLGLNKSKACTYISSSINTDVFVPINSYSNNRIVTIGWTGTFSSKIQLDILRDVFFLLAKRCQFKLRIIGNFQYELPGVDIEVIQWSKRNEVADLQAIDIGVYPLIMQDDFVMGKSGLKAIQYMAFGLPTVASDIGTSRQIIKHLDNGWLVKNETEWVDALETLVNSPELRRKLGTAARTTVMDRYSTRVIKLDYLSILNKYCREVS